MDNKIKTNKLSIYLIKEEFNSPEKIIKDDDTISSHSLNDLSTLYVKDSKIHPPDWIKSFFLKIPDNFNLKNASSQALLLTKVKIEENIYRYFVIPFGVGYHLLRTGVIEERFGLKVVLNTINETGWRSIDKTNMSNVPKQAREQISLNSGVADFGIDIEQDLILGVTGKAKDDFFGKTITGRDALKVSVKQNIDTINNFLLKCYKQYCKDEYKTNFGWIDQIAEIKNPTLINGLNEKIIAKIKKSDFEKLWMAIPEIIDWEDVEGFHYSYNTEDEKFDDIYIYDFLHGLFPEKKYDEISITTFTENKVLCYSSSSDLIIHRWKAFQCLYCEIVEDKSTYILTNGKWYEIENNFVQQINSEYQQLLCKPCSVSLPDYNHTNEGDYNIKVSENMRNICCMDKKNISYGGGYSKIEFCDLFSQKKQLIHIKQYGGSSVLSHLFNQGLVSGELFRADKDFREKVNDKLPISHRIADILNINPSEYEIIYAVISHFKKELDIPFFSKVSLKNAKRRLETIGYNVYLMKINSEKAIEIEEE